MIASTLRAGHGFRTALGAIADDGASPSSDEFGQVLGRGEAGTAARRGDCRDVRADRVTRSRVRRDRRARPVPDGRLARWSLRHPLGDRSRAAAPCPQGQGADRPSAACRRSCSSSMPVGLAALMTLMSPSYMAPLYTTSSGHMLIVACTRVDGDRVPAPQTNRLCEVLTMIILLVAGLGCLALLGFQLVRPRATAEQSAPRGTRGGSRRRGRRGDRSLGACTKVRASRTRLRRCSCRIHSEALAEAVAGRPLDATSPRRRLAPPDR